MKDKKLTEKHDKITYSSSSLRGHTVLYNGKRIADPWGICDIGYEAGRKAEQARILAWVEKRFEDMPADSEEWSNSTRYAMVMLLTELEKLIKGKVSENRRFADKEIEKLIKGDKK